MMMFILLAALIPACSEDSAGPTLPVDDVEDYAVYSALIASQFLSESTMLVVISDSTEPYTFFDEVSREFILSSLKVSAALLDTYNSRNAAPAAMRRAFDFDTEYVLLATEEQQAILSTGGWDEFYRRYPASQGYLTLSRVGFSQDGNTALVYASNTPAFLAGMGICAVLEKQGGEWKVTETVIVWVS
jgi:hypothetical protein